MESKKDVPKVEENIEKQKNNKVAKAFFKAIRSAKACFDENSMEEEEL